MQGQGSIQQAAPPRVKKRFTESLGFLVLILLFLSALAATGFVALIAAPFTALALCGLVATAILAVLGFALAMVIGVMALLLPDAFN